MRYVLCTVLDTVAAVYSRPFCARSNAEAQRIFAHMCEHDEQVAKSPSDYRLYVIGNFDESSGEVEGSRPDQLGHGQSPMARNGRVKGGLRRFLAGRGS